MKKTLAVLLTVCMMFAFVPFIAFAATDPIALDPASPIYSLESNKEYVIPSGVTYVVPAGTRLYVGENSKLTVAEGGSLMIDKDGGVTVYPTGELYVDGAISNADKIDNKGTAMAKITFPSLYDCNLQGDITVSYAFSYSGSAYDDITGGTISYTHVSDDGESIYAPLNQYLYIIAHIIEPVADRDKFDDALMKVRLNNVEIPYTQGNHHTLLGTSGTISYSTWTNDDDFLNTYRIDLPNKEGYQVVGREGELGATDQTVYLKYGKPFSFRVDIDPAYDKSPYQVYIVSGYGWTNMGTSTILQDLEPAQPDSNGYYNIPSVESDYTVFVMGVIENATVEKVGGIFEQVKSIFEMIRKFFAQFLALFGINM